MTGEVGEHQQQRHRGWKPQADPGTSLEHHPALAGALPPQGPHDGTAADQSGEDSACLVQEHYQGSLSSVLFSAVLLGPCHSYHEA